MKKYEQEDIAAFEKWLRKVERKTVAPLVFRSAVIQAKAFHVENKIKEFVQTAQLWAKDPK